jgi:hypothetical protein
MKKIPLTPCIDLLQLQISQRILVFSRIWRQYQAMNHQIQLIPLCMGADNHGGQITLIPHVTR